MIDINYLLDCKNFMRLIVLCLKKVAGVGVGVGYEGLGSKYIN